MRWLASQARREGGDVVMLLGNHDAMQARAAAADQGHGGMHLA